MEETNRTASRKPQVAEKSLIVLRVAQEILLQKQRHQGKPRSLSDSEIYDDILSIRELQEDDVYDDVIPVRSLALKLTSKEQPLSTSPDENHYVCEQGHDSTLTASLCYDYVTRPSPSKHRPPLQVSSFEDIYDDVIVYRSKQGSNSKGFGTKPSAPPKSKRLYNHPRVREMIRQQRLNRAQEIEEIYDSMIALASEGSSANADKVTQRENDRQNDSDGSLEEVYIDPGMIQHSDDSGNEAESEHPTSSPGHNQTQQYHCYDSVNQQPQEEGTMLQVHYHNFGLQNSPNNKLRRENHRKVSRPNVDNLSQQSDSLQPLPGRTVFDPLPQIGSSPKLSGTVERNPVPLPIAEYETSDEEDYETLALYEDVEQYQEGDGASYQDIEQAVIEALDLPKQIRDRTNRIVKGHKSRKLQKSFKKRKQFRDNRTKSMPPMNDLVITDDPQACTSSVDLNPEGTTLNSSTPNVPEPKSNHANSDAVDQSSTDMKTANISPRPDDAQEDTRESDHGSESSQEEGGVPFGKSREVFELLLDASNIVRIPERSPQQPRSSKLHDTHNGNQHTSTDDAQGYLGSVEFQKLSQVATTELRSYQEAGIVQLRTKSEIEADIKEIVENAPSKPPPLPGFQRPRSNVLTMKDRVVQRRVALRRRHTLQSTSRPATHT